MPQLALQDMCQVSTALNLWSGASWYRLNFSHICRTSENCLRKFEFAMSVNAESVIIHALRVTSYFCWLSNMQQGLQSEGHRTCLCGRSFSVPSALTKHSRTCGKTKKRLSSALEKAKETWTLRKRRRLLEPSDFAANEPLPAGLTRALSIPIQHIVEVCYNPFKFMSLAHSTDSHYS
jgi:hypothetical protein